MAEHDEYAEFLQSQILELQERLANHEHDKHSNRARLAKLHGVKFADPNQEIQSLRDKVEKLTSYNGELVSLIEETNSQMNMNTVKHIVEMHKLRRKLLW